MDLFPGLWSIVPGWVGSSGECDLVRIGGMIVALVTGSFKGGYGTGRMDTSGICSF